MISGETEALIDNHLFEDDYDDFFGNKKKRKARRAKRKAKRLTRRLQRKTNTKKGGFFKDVGQVYKDIGGATAIGGVVDAILMPKDTQIEPIPSDLPSDYQFSVGSSQDDDNDEKKEEEKKGIPTIVYIVGGIAVVGIVGLLIMQAKKAKQVQTFSQ